MSSGIQAIAAERQRQIDAEGWSMDHDDGHTDQSLAVVAALYAMPFQVFTAETHSDGRFFQFEDPWPASWEADYDRRQDFDRRRRLVIAGALIAAEIDRLDRASEAET